MISATKNLGDGHIHKVFDDEKIDTVAVFTENVFRFVFQKIGIVFKLNLECTGSGFVPVYA